MEELLENGETVGPYVGHLHYMDGKDLKQYKYENIVQYDTLVREQASDGGLKVFGKRNNESLGSDAVLPKSEMGSFGVEVGKGEGEGDGYKRASMLSVE